MNKVIIGSILSLAIASTTLNASPDVKSTMDFSVGTVAFDKSNPRGSVGMDFEIERRIIGDLYFGVGVNAELYRSSFYDDYMGSNTVSNDLGVMVDFYPVISYNITNHLSVNALYAYTAGELGSQTFDGTTYGFGADYKFGKNWGCGVNYKMSKLEFTTIHGKDIDTERVNGTLFYRF